MLSLIRPDSLFPSFVPFFATRNYQYEEGVPFVQQDSSNWYVKVFLPDVEESDFNVSVNDSKLQLKWKDNKQIKHRGRIYTSSEEYEKLFEIPKEITEADVKVSWEDDFAIITIPKPQKQLQISTKDDSVPQDGILMKLSVPKEGDHSLEVNVKDNHLSVVFETSGKREHGEGNNKYFSTFHNKIQRMIPIPEGVDPSDIDTQVVNGELVVQLKNCPALKNNPENATNESSSADVHMEESADSTKG